MYGGGTELLENFTQLNRLKVKKKVMLTRNVEERIERISADLKTNGGPDDIGKVNSKEKWNCGVPSTEMTTMITPEGEKPRPECY